MNDDLCSFTENILFKIIIFNNYSFNDNSKEKFCTKSDNEEEVVVKSRKGTLDTIKKSDSYDPFEFDIPSFIRKKK